MFRRCKSVAKSSNVSKSNTSHATFNGHIFAQGHGIPTLAGSSRTWVLVNSPVLQTWAFDMHYFTRQRPKGLKCFCPNLSIYESRSKKHNEHCVRPSDNQRDGSIVYNTLSTYYINNSMIAAQKTCQVVTHINSTTHYSRLSCFLTRDSHPIFQINLFSHGCRHWNMDFWQTITMNSTMPWFGFRMTLQNTELLQVECSIATVLGRSNQHDKSVDRLATKQRFDMLSSVLTSNVGWSSLGIVLKFFNAVKSSMTLETKWN